ncbi:MAG: hypothetical protein ACRD9S_08660 [Pyrinomonadaceae bacterium]
MKTIKNSAFKALMIAAALFSLALPAILASESAHAQREQQQLTVLGLLDSTTRTERGDVILAMNGNELTGVTFKDTTKGRAVRHRMFSLTDRTQVSGVKCDAKDAEFGSLARSDGSWIAVAVCSPTPQVTAIAIPSLIRARASANEASATEMKCWENKELKMGVCFKPSSDLTTKPMPQTREHILLARQVGVPSL